jgi:hypothetical protein
MRIRFCSIAGLLLVLCAHPAFSGGVTKGSVASTRSILGAPHVEDLLPPPNDQCGGADLLSCAANINKRGSTAAANNDYFATDSVTFCTGASVDGRDVVYKLNVGPGDSLWVDYTNLQVDGAFYLVTNCADVQNTCVASADVFPTANTTESIRYKFVSGGIYYLILDSHGFNSGGDFRLVGQLVCGPSTPPQNDLCEAAIPLACGQDFNLSGSTQFAHSEITFPNGNPYTGHVADGNDVAYSMTVAAGDSISVSYTSTTDASMYIVYDCYNPTNSCVVGADATGPGQMEQIHFKFSFSGTYYLILDSRVAGSFGTWTASGHLFCANAAPSNDRCDNPIPIACGPINYSGSTIYATNDYHFSGLESCTGYTTDGKDITFRLDVNAGDSLNVTYTSNVDGSIYILSNCALPDSACVAGADVGVDGDPETLRYKFVAGGTYYLILDSVQPNTGSAVTLTGALYCNTSAVDLSLTSPLSFGSARPNPFSQLTRFAYSLSENAHALVRVYDLQGRVVRTMVDKDLPAGNHSVSWDGTDDAGARVHPGVYFARLSIGERAAMRRMVFVR